MYIGKAFPCVSGCKNIKCHDYIWNELIKSVYFVKTISKLC